jgi:hypothetical protein
MASPRKKSGAAGPRLVTLTWAAGEVDLSTKQLTKYAVIPGCPRRSDGKGGWLYEWPAFNRFVRETLARDAAAAASPGDLDEAKLRKLAAEAELAELALGKERGQLVEVSRYEREMGRAFARVRSRLLSLPVRAAPDVLGLKDERGIETVLDRYVLEILAELRREAVPDDGEEAEEEAKPAPRTRPRARKKAA